MIIFQRLVALLVSISIILFSLGNVHAAMITNEAIVHNNLQLQDKQALLQKLHRSEVQEQLQIMGVDPASVEERINHMTSEEISQLNMQMQQLPAGGDIVGLIVLVFIIFVITDVIGATDIFPFIHPVR